MVDWDRIAELQTEVGEDGIGEIVSIFLEEVEEGVDELAGLSDREAIGDKLHFLKGSAQNIGLSEFSALCLEGEAAAKQGAVKPDIETIRAALTRARDELASLTR